MAVLDQTAAALRIMGDDLDPDEITALLGAAPTNSNRKGDIRVGRVTGQQIVERSGGWILETPRKTPGDLDAQTAEILDPLTKDLSVWRDLTSRFRADLFCGLFLRHGNEGLLRSPKTLLSLGERGIELDLDIYGGDEDEED